jgi:hypothetical protein
LLAGSDVGPWRWFLVFKKGPSKPDPKASSPP